MLDWSTLQSILIIAMACSSVTVIFIQKTKGIIKNSKLITFYSLLVNVVLGFLFSQSFSDINYINSIWTGLFSFLGADTLYKSLDSNFNINLENNNATNETQENLQPSSNNKEDIIGEIKYE